jgi:hypothetical protein
VIYAIHAVGSNFVKFGKAKRVKKRLDTHQIGCPLQLKLLAEADWPDLAEGKIHRLLWGSRERGEWFRMDKPVLNVIALMNEPGGLERLETVLVHGVGSLAARRLKKILDMTEEDARRTA